jgi:hypothetical protein
MIDMKQVCVRMDRDLYTKYKIWLASRNKTIQEDLEEHIRKTVTEEK